MVELNVNSDLAWGVSRPDGGMVLMDAIDLASDQDEITWLTDEDGKRIAAIVPVDVAEHYLGCMGEAGGHAVQDAVTAWAGDAGVSASEFMSLSLDRRREILDQFYARLHGGTPCPECSREGTHKMGCSRR